MHVRQGRYVGLAQTYPQHVFTVTALKIVGVGA